MKTLTVVGQGYVGLPLAQEAARAGLRVHGFDIHEGLVRALNAGHSHVDDLTEADVEEMLTRGYRATTDPSVVRESDYVVICVPTPLLDGGGPDLGAVEGASRAVARHLDRGTLVVLESTTYPGTTENVVLPLLEEGSGLRHGEDFLLAFSPERVDPGSKRFGIRNTPKLVGGVTTAGTEAAADFYSLFVDTVVPLKGAREAEAAKLLENTYRHVNIALVNEMAKFCHEMDIDIWEVIRGAATKPFGFQRFTPGPGVGGHCIPIDPNYLSYEVRRKLGYPFRFVELAQEINNGMPEYVFRRVADLLNDEGKAVRGAAVLLLGVTYKPDVADQRESPAVPLAERLIAKGARLAFHDPYVPTWCLPSGERHVVEDLDRAVRDADIVVVLQSHRAYDMSALSREARVLFDTRGTAPAPAHRL